jgi:hypothetical protein
MLKSKPTTGDTSWFVQDCFGMFIHWGLFTLPSRHEWESNHFSDQPDVLVITAPIRKPDVVVPIIELTLI